MQNKLIPIPAGIVLFALATSVLAAGFRDVPPSHPNFDAIQYVLDQGIVEGYPDGTFKPDQTINRAEFTKIVTLALFGQTMIDQCGTFYSFSDVPRDAWYVKFVCRARDGWLLTGYPDGTFRPAQSINFGEAAKILANGYNLIQRTEYCNGKLCPDVDTVDHPWYEQYVRAIAEKNAIPTSISRFDQPITRGEMAEMIYRIHAPVTNKASQTFDSLNAAANQSAFIALDSVSDGQMVYAQPFQMSGVTSANCSSITVNARNDQYGVNDTYTLTAYQKGDTTFVYNIAHEWHNLDVGKNVYTFTARCDNGNPTKTVSIFFEAGGGVEMGKPVIYLYPEQTEQVRVLPQPEGGVTVSRPALDNGWTVTAHPDGTLVNADGKIWPYLFWEGFANLVAPHEGFVVAKANLDNFFSEKLAFLGLNAKEIADFKEFWLARMAEEGYYVIHFVDQAQLDIKAPLAVSPAPDTSIRVFFDYEFSKTPVTVPEQKLEAGKARDGFTLIEWGGRLYR